ncbi:hypothetical protein FA13DRAFT_1731688 [Coprinellus micaceus]|uniref:Uncharacterized protein n=1 Tax=Coprinellus micaceus TaxID=71717 RepID=A0A4Y7TE67_COPMI|nr:hypothetical protein FA13DRAFT_1731688 [Coprinellus micaceus]
MSQAMFKNTVTSPVARAFVKRPMNPRSILRRPAALPMSPTTQPVFASFSVMAPSMKSPHVQFMASPQLVATFTTHSSDTYDRAPIKVSPNPLELPGRGDRYYSPCLENFRLADPPKPKAAVQKRLDSILAQQCASPAITDFEDPRSPKVVDATQQVRFASFAASPARPARDLKASISGYPRSPYPSATLPSEVEGSQDGAKARRMSDSTVDLSNRPAGVSTAPRKAPRLPNTIPSIPSPLQQSFRTPLKTPVKTPLTAGLQRSHRPAPLAISPQDDATALSDAFWDAYPESAMEMEEVNLKSPAPQVQSPGPALIFGTQDGGVWTPSAPKQPAARETLLRSALMSPGKVAFARVKRSNIASPSPNDPFASFPSFAAALTMAQSDPTIAYPAPAVMAA